MLLAVIASAYMRYFGETPTGKVSDKLWAAYVIRLPTNPEVYRVATFWGKSTGSFQANPGKLALRVEALDSYKADISVKLKRGYKTISPYVFPSFREYTNKRLMEWFTTIPDQTSLTIADINDAAKLHVPWWDAPQSAPSPGRYEKPGSQAEPTRREPRRISHLLHDL